MHFLLSIFLFGAGIAQIHLQDEHLTVELASTENERAQGLMNRQELPEGSGMLFVFPKAEKLSFWMKNTKIPLSVGFFDEKKRLINIEDMVPFTGLKPPIYKSQKNALYALEVPLGWFEHHHICLNTSFEWDQEPKEAK